MPTRVILHIGMPKCGSSALQTSLSLAPELAAAHGGSARYVALQSSGSVLHGARLRAHARLAVTGYAISARAAHLENLDGMRFAQLRRRLAQLGSDSRLVLSNEGWGNNHAVFAAGHILERLDVAAEVVMYVRPQVEWCNSAWWQWGAWTAAADREFSRWLSRQFARMQWGEVARRWREVPGVVSVRARLLPKAVAGDFCSLIGAVAPQEISSNSSLPGVVLRLFQRHPELRGGAHDTAVDFALGRHLRFTGGPVPWIMSREAAVQVIESCRDSNELLMGFLEPAQQQAMRADPAWWSADSWAARPLESIAPPPEESAELDRLAATAIGVIRELDARNRELRTTLGEIRSGRRFPWRLPWRRKAPT